MERGNGNYSGSFDYTLRMPNGRGGYYSAGIQNRLEGHWWQVQRAPGESTNCTDSGLSLNEAKGQAESVINGWHSEDESNWQPMDFASPHGVVQPGRAI